LSNIETINFSDILEKLNKNKQWIDHITISGGEPTIYNDLFELVDLLNSNNFKVKVDSNASRPEMIKDLINYVEMFSIDIKGPYEKYPELTGFRITEEQIKENFENNIFPLAKEYPHKFQFRTTLVPLLEHQDILKIQSYPPSSFKIQFQYYQEVS
jgi:pyruvate formate lyase activating enzyme